MTVAIETTLVMEGDLSSRRTRSFRVLRLGLGDRAGEVAMDAGRRGRSGSQPLRRGVTRGWRE